MELYRGHVSRARGCGGRQSGHSDAPAPAADLLDCRNMAQETPLLKKAQEKLAQIEAQILGLHVLARALKSRSKLLKLVSPPTVVRSDESRKRFSMSRRKRVPFGYWYMPSRNCAHRLNSYVTIFRGDVDVSV